MPAYAITIQVTTSILLVIRLFSRILRTKARAGLDDAFIVVAWLFGLALTVLTLLCIS